jgi:hypothetical protein
MTRLPAVLTWTAVGSAALGVSIACSSSSSPSVSCTEHPDAAADHAAGNSAPDAQCAPSPTPVDT